MMQKAYSIKENLPVSTEQFSFSRDEDGKINRINFSTSDELDVDTMNSVVSVFDENLDSYQLQVSLERGSVSAMVR